MKHLLNRYRDFNGYLREVFGERVQKISLDAGLSCPNRDGTISDKGCIFCDISQSKVVKSNELAVVIKDNYPVTKHHCLIIPKRHCSDYFDLYQPEINAISQLINEMKTELQKKDKTIKGFNIGNNSGEVSGQTIFHCHIHLIPRRRGDTENPRGGVRGVIINKQSY